MNKPAVQLLGVYGNLPENLPSRAVGATAKGVYNRAVEANASARAKTASKTSGRAGGPVPFPMPELGADQYLVHQAPAGKRISSNLLLPDKPSKVAVKEVQEVPASVPPAKVGDAGTSKSVAAPAALLIGKGAAAKKAAAQKSKPPPTVSPPSAVVTAVEDIFAFSDDDFGNQPKLGKQKTAASSQFPLGFKPGVFAGSSTVKAAAPPLSPSRSRTPPKARAPPLSRSRSRTPPTSRSRTPPTTRSRTPPKANKLAAANATSNRVDEVLGGDDPIDDEGDAALYDTSNASAVAAATTAASGANADDIHIDLGRADASTMPNWWDMFLNSKCGGGFLARSLFSAAAQDSVLAAHKWSGPTSVKCSKSALAEMRVKWIEWNENLTVNEWVRAKLFHIIVTNPTTYAKIKVNEVL